MRALRKLTFWSCGPQPNLIPFSHCAPRLARRFAVSGSDLILLCTTNNRLVSNNGQHQNLRRVRVCSLPRSPTMIKPPRALAHSPILCSYCAPCLCDPDEPYLMLFFRSVFWPGSYAFPVGNSPARSRSVPISLFCSLLALKWARRSSLVAARAPYKTTASPGLLLHLLLRFYRNLSWSVLFAFPVQ